MYALMPWIAVIVTALAGWALIKRYSTHMVLLFAGLAILLCAVVLGDPNFLPKGVKPSGFVLFDIFNTLKSIATKQSAGIGFLIMTAGGFAAYMDRIGAAKALVDIAVKPLSMLRAPYLVLVGGYFVGQILVMVIPSAAGLAMLLLIALFPILKAVGTSAAAAAAVIGTSADKKNDDVYTDVSAAKAADQPAAPKWYAVFPILPIALLIIFSKLVVASIKLDTVSALFMVWIGVVIIEIIRSRDVKKVFKDGLAMFQSMGKMFAGIVALIICAEFFATGLKVSGLIDILINSAQGVGAGMGAMTVILTAIVSIVTFLTGSGVGAYSSFATLAPDVAAGLGGSVAELVTPMQFASGLLRAMSPVAGVIIAVAGAAGVSPMAIVRRTWIPMILGIITAIIANEIFIG